MVPLPDDPHHPDVWNLVGIVDAPTRGWIYHQRNAVKVDDPATVCCGVKV